MWVIDIRHWLDKTQTEPAAPQLKEKIKKLSEIITYVTSMEAGIKVGHPPTCWARPKHKPCSGILKTDANSETGQIHWVCPACGDEGVVSGWNGLIWDMSDRPDTLH